MKKIKKKIISGLKCTSEPEENENERINASTSSSISLNSSKDMTTVLKVILIWPKQNKLKSKRTMEHQPSVITSKKWVEIHEAKEKALQEKEQLKKDKKIIAATKKISTEAKKIESKLKREKAKELKKLVKPKKIIKINPKKTIPIKYTSSEESDIENKEDTEDEFNDEEIED